MGHWWLDCADAKVNMTDADACCLHIGAESPQILRCPMQSGLSVPSVAVITRRWTPMLPALQREPATYDQG